jgi:hypothetical protein
MPVRTDIYIYFYDPNLYLLCCYYKAPAGHEPGEVITTRTLFDHLSFSFSPVAVWGLSGPLKNLCSVPGRQLRQLFQLRWSLLEFNSYAQVIPQVRVI